jgi:osmotically-inducible protein OsmY
MRITGQAGFIFATAMGALVALPAYAAFDEPRIDPMTLPSNAVHTGAATFEDHQLASDIVSAISADPAMAGATLTVVVQDGRITMSGSARDIAQVARAEKIANDIARGRRVEGKLDVQGG